MSVQVTASIGALAEPNYAEPRPVQGTSIAFVVPSAVRRRVLGCGRQAAVPGHRVDVVGHLRVACLPARREDRAVVAEVVRRVSVEGGGVGIELVGPLTTLAVPLMSAWRSALSPPLTQASW